MTAPSPATIEREKDIDLYVTDAQMIRKLNIPEAVIRPVIKMLDADPRKGFPKKDPLFGGRRYWPSIQQWMANRGGDFSGPVRTVKASDDASYRVYFLGSPTHVKIGITSKHIKKRIQTIRQVHYEKLELLAIIPNVPRELEKHLHKKFAALKEKGEWFRRGPEIEAFIQIVRSGRYRGEVE